MSILATHLRSILFSNLRPDFSAAQRKAAWNLFNAVDSDLDIAGYTDNESSTTIEALERLDLVLKHGEDTVDDIIDDIIDEPIDEPLADSPRAFIDIELDEDEIE